MRGAAIACLRASFFRCSERELWSAALSSELLLAHRPHVGGYSGRLISAARLRSSVPRGVWRHEGNHLVDRCHLASANGNTESVLRWGRALALVRWLPCGEHICEHREYRHISRGTTNEGATAPAGGGRAGAAALLEYSTTIHATITLHASTVSPLGFATPLLSLSVRQLPRCHRAYRTGGASFRKRHMRGAGKEISCDGLLHQRGLPAVGGGRGL